MGAGRGKHDKVAFGGEGFTSGESSFRFPVIGDGRNASHSGGVDLSLDNVLESGCLGSKGWVRLGVIETMAGNSGDGLTGGNIGSSGRNDDEATGGDDRKGVLGMGEISHGRC